jgi:hypothetical protein
MSQNKQQQLPSPDSYRGYSGGMSAQDMKPPAKVPSGALIAPKKAAQAVKQSSQED